MNIWDHSRISVRKFGGKEEDYYQIHKFIDSSKLFYFNPKHRLLLHNLWGIEVTIKKFGDIITNFEHDQILVRDIAAEHCKEDLNGKVPSLQDWLSKNEDNISAKIKVPEIDDKKLAEFVFLPYWKSNLKSSLLVTVSNFGVYLANEILGIEYAKRLQKKLNKEATIQNYLSLFKFSDHWQFTPQQKELEWVKGIKKKKKS